MQPEDIELYSSKSYGFVRGNCHKVFARETKSGEECSLQ